MEELITSYLIQKKECYLPLLGSFTIKQGSASLDIADKTITPFTDEVIYSENETYLSNGLKNYISHLQHIELHEAEEKINNWCLNAKMKLDTGEKINFDSIGTLQKAPAGNILFQTEKKFNFYEPVAAERVIHKNAEHSVLVGDKETTSGAMNEFYREDGLIEKKYSWKLWAIILLVLSLLILVFYFSNHALSVNGIANQSTFPIQQPPAAYSVPK
jgi:hypothetical protein